ncbi:MAG: c-type cytochrome [Planctomycetota bacterium]|jgi:mono/diheme cytochrome c family protein
MRRTALLLLIGLTAWAQGALGDPERGRRIFHDTGENLAYPSCAHCHAVVDDAAEVKTGRVRPGHPVFNSAHRGAWKNGNRKLKTAGDAGNTCVVSFQKRKRLPADRVADLEAYLRTISPGKAKPRRLGFEPALPESLDGGDRARGRTLVQRYCAGCHGASEQHLQDELKAGRRKRGKVAMKVRGWIKDKRAPGGMRFKPAHGQMSFFAKDRLPDEDLRDILAYVGRG